MDAIYKTDYFSEKYEKYARENIISELLDLQ
jgi:predicted metal-dependent HD superfamily phosphohydrolase